MLKAKGMPSWAQQVTVALSYGVAYFVLREFIGAVSFQPYSGLRLTLLFLLPVRLWPALAVGEFAVLSANAIQCAYLYGTTWAVVRSIPTVALAFPIVYLARKRWTDLMEKLSERFLVIFLAGMVCSVLWSLNNFAVFVVTKMPAAYTPPPYNLVLERYFLGQCIGIIILTPLTLWINTLVKEKLDRNELWERFTSSKLTMETAIMLIPSLIFLTWLATKGGDVSDMARMAIFLPAAALTLRNGWLGAAVGSALAACCVLIAVPEPDSQNALNAQAFITFASSILLVLGGRISALHKREEQERVEERRAMLIAQKSIMQSERRLHQAAEALDEIRDVMAVSQDYMLDRFQRLLSPAEQRGYRRDAAQTQQLLYQLAGGLSPRIRGERDLPITLSTGTLARALDEAGVAYRCDVHGKIEHSLGPVLPIALYRLACEAALSLCDQHHAMRLHLRLRSGVSGGKVWALLSLEGREAANEPFGNIAPLKRHIGASGLDMDALRDQARIYGGNLKIRSTSGGQRIIILLTDEAEAA